MLSEIPRRQKIRNLAWLGAAFLCGACTNPPSELGTAPPESSVQTAAANAGAPGSVQDPKGVVDAGSDVTEQPKSTKKFAWPGGARAAVTLTHDDGIKSQIEIAVPELDKRGLKGTFFVSGDHGALPMPQQSSLDDYQSQWAKVGASGHELAGHTYAHPCNERLQSFTLEIMSKDLDSSIEALRALGAKEPLTFAYPCSSDVLGIGSPRVSYASLIEERFLAARVAKEGIADPTTVALQHVPQLDASGKTFEELQQWINQAVTLGGWVVIMFHGVGGDYLTTTAEVHASLLAHLAEHKNDVWTAPLRDVAQHIENNR